MNILITGVHGFVGSNLVKAMGGKHAVYGLDIVAPAVAGVVKTFTWEDLDAKRIPHMDVIIHLAGKAHDTKNKSAAVFRYQYRAHQTGVRLFPGFRCYPVCVFQLGEGCCQFRRRQRGAYRGGDSLAGGTLRREQDCGGEIYQ